MPRSRANPNVDGVLVVDKQSGMSSYDVIRRLKKVLGTSRLGHTGTLDPMATGVLVVCAGWSTRLVPYLSDGWKEYTGEIRLGVRTETDDAEGAVVETREVRCGREELQAAAACLTGEIEQVPPAYSAVHVGGERAYAVARRGDEVALEPRKVTVERFDVDLAAPDRVAFRVRVSKGTYVRSLARDLGELLGCGAHLASLRRTVNEPFTVDEATPLESVLGPRALLSPFDALRSLPVALVDPAGAADLRQGRIALPAGQPDEGQRDEGRTGAACERSAEPLVRVACSAEPGELVAVCSRIETGGLRPVRVRPSVASDALRHQEVADPEGVG